MGINFFGETEAAEDAVQEALIKLWAAWQQLPSKVDAERLAVRLTKYACIDLHRRMQKEQTIPMEKVPLTETTSDDTATDTLHGREIRDAVTRAVSMLRPSERRLWTMFAEAQMDTAQIAAATAIHPRSVRAMLSTA